MELLLTNGTHPEAEIDKETTPGGIAIKGLNEMKHADFTSAVTLGLKVSKVRSDLPQNIQKQVAMLTVDVSVVLSMAVEFGTVGFTGEPVEVKYAGSGKVLSCQ